MAIGFTGGGGIDWSGKTSKFISGTANVTSGTEVSVFSVSGSGYIKNIQGIVSTSNSDTTLVRVFVDGQNIYSSNISTSFGGSGIPADSDGKWSLPSLDMGFDSSFEIKVKGDGGAGATSVVSNYALD